jgi:hypothetical protein
VKKIVSIIGLIMLSLNLWSWENKPQPFEYFEPNIYANKFDEKTGFVEGPAMTGAAIGDTVGIAAGYPLGIVGGLPVSLVTESDEPMGTGMYYGWLCIGLPVRLLLAQAVSAPSFMVKKVFWDLPRYCYDPAAYKN